MPGSDDFDFLHAGPWEVHNHRRDAAGRWARFEGRSVVEPLTGMPGHLDRLSVAAFPGAGSVEAFTLRLFEPESGLWRIWWSASTRPGHLDPPMVGSFGEDGTGVFHGDDALTGGVSLRFVWEPDAAGGPRWEQARSRDGGASWDTDWTMVLTRERA